MFTVVPQQYITEFIKSANETVNLMPKDDAKVGDKSLTKQEFRQMEKSDSKAGVIDLTTLTIEDNGEISGLTLGNEVLKVLNLGIQLYILLKKIVN